VHGGGLCLVTTNISLRNTIVHGSTAAGGVWFDVSPNAQVNYCDIFGNIGGDLAGGVPAGLGVISGVNYNGDPCDSRHNIYLDPLFVNAAAGDFHLQAESPCIDAGDPASPPDPDGTICDIGRFYYHQVAAPVAVTLTPLNPPIQIPATGGSFSFNVGVANNSSTPQSFAAWIMVTLPNGSQYGPVLGPINLTLPAGMSLNRDRTQAVPAGAPAGTYAYTAKVGVYPNEVWDEDSFNFVKLSSGNGTEIGGSTWLNLGEDLDIAASSTTSACAADFALSAHPNPCNPRTTLRYRLPEAGEVTIVVVDVQGRGVSARFAGMQEAGEHEWVFDGSDLASGIYFVSLRAGEFVKTEKVVLLK
jgi:hypothetical protein